MNYFNLDINAMKRSVLFLVAFVFVVQLELSAQQVNQDSLLVKADSLYDNFVEKEALEAYKLLLQQDSLNYEALWRSSFLYSRIGNRQQEKETQREYFNQAKSLVEKALEVDSTDAQSHYVMSVAMGRMALISGARDRVAASREIKRHVDRALAFDSTHAGAWHVLGRWHFKVANLSFVERLAANTLFGGIPGDASNNKAAEAIERAIELNDDYVLYYHDLAMVYDEMGNKQKAIQACQSALKKENLTPDDSGLKKECREWIEEWKR